MLGERGSRETRLRPEGASKMYVTVTISGAHFFITMNEAIEKKHSGFIRKNTGNEQSLHRFIWMAEQKSGIKDDPKL